MACAACGGLALLVLQAMIGLPLLLLFAGASKHKDRDEEPRT